MKDDFILAISTAHKFELNGNGWKGEMEKDVRKKGKRRWKKEKEDG